MRKDVNLLVFILGCDDEAQAGLAAARALVASDPRRKVVSQGRDFGLPPLRRIVREAYQRLPATATASLANKKVLAEKSLEALEQEPKTIGTRDFDLRGRRNTGLVGW